MSMDGNIYYLQYGSYINYNVLEENIKNLSNYVIYEEDGKYYVYIGAYLYLDHAKKMQRILENKNIYTYIKNDYLSNENLLNSIKTIEKKIVNNEKFLEEGNNEIINLLKKA